VDRRLLETAVVAVQSVVMQANDRRESALAEHGLTHATAQALWAIDPDEDPPSMKTMAARLFCQAPNLSFVTTQLVERGLVERVVDPGDRRSRLMVLTPQGHRVRAAVIDATVATSPLAELDEHDLRALVTVLRRAVDASGATGPDDAAVRP
jgi:DNA-binding MarR family transcriptional regulator